MPDSPRTLFILHFSWVSKWLWETVIVKESWKSSNDLGMRQSINILNMKHSGMIKLELHVSLQKDTSMLHVHTPKPNVPNDTKKNQNVDNMKKILLKSDQKCDCGELLNPGPQICYILSFKGSASFWWRISVSKLPDKWELKEILDVNLMVTGTHSEPKGGLLWEDPAYSVTLWHFFPILVFIYYNIDPMSKSRSIFEMPAQKAFPYIGTQVNPFSCSRYFLPLTQACSPPLQINFNLHFSLCFEGYSSKWGEKFQDVNAIIQDPI